MRMTWDPTLIFLSYIVSVQGAYTTIKILQQVKTWWASTLAALSLSLCGIWCMHFIGMQAMLLDGSPVTFSYGWSIASVVFAYVPALLAFMILLYKVPLDLAHKELTMASHVSAVMNAPWHWILLSSFLLASGICSMHYVGTHSVITEGKSELHWGFIIGSVVIAFTAAVAALSFIFVLPVTIRYVMPSAFVMGVAVCGMHYTGMYGVQYKRHHSTGAMAPLGAATPQPTVRQRGRESVLLAWVPLLVSSTINWVLMSMTNTLQLDAIESAAGTAAEHIEVLDMMGLESVIADSLLSDTAKAKFNRICDTLALVTPYIPGIVLQQIRNHVRGTSNDSGDDNAHGVHDVRPGAIELVGRQSNDPLDCSVTSMSLTSPHTAGVPFDASSGSQPPVLSSSNSSQLVGGTPTTTVLDKSPSSNSTSGGGVSLIDLPPALQPASGSGNRSRVSRAIMANFDGLHSRDLTLVCLRVVNWTECLDATSKVLAFHETLSSALALHNGTLEHNTFDMVICSWNSFKRQTSHERLAKDFVFELISQCNLSGMRFAVGILRGWALSGTVATSAWSTMATLGGLVPQVKDVCHYAHSVLEVHGHGYVVISDSPTAMQYHALACARVMDSASTTFHGVLYRILAPRAIENKEWMYALEDADSNDVCVQFNAAFLHRTGVNENELILDLKHYAPALRNGLHLTTAEAVASADKPCLCYPFPRDLRTHSFLGIAS